MNKIILMATMLAAVLTANAQARFEAGTFTLQPRIGGTGSTFTNAPDLTTPDFKTSEATASGGSFTGVDLEYYLTRRVGLAAGLNWSQAGTGWDGYKFTENGIKYDVKEHAWKTDYVAIPLTVNWYVAKGFALKTGVQVGFLVDAKEYVRSKYTAGGNKYNMTMDTGIKDNFKKVDVSIPVGLSYDFKFPFVIDLRYNIGLTKVNDFNADKDFRNLQAVLTLGYKFKL